jgi:hydrogenase maturation protein HypF
VLSRRFHNSLVHVFVEVSIRLRDKTGIDRVCLSGGTFNNMYLSEQLEAGLRGAGFQVFQQREVPCGDGGLSLGQAMVAAHTGTNSVESHLKK